MASLRGSNQLGGCRLFPHYSGVAGGGGGGGGQKGGRERERERERERKRERERDYRIVIFRVGLLCRQLAFQSRNLKAKHEL